MESKDDIEKATLYTASICEEIGFVEPKNLEEEFNRFKRVVSFSGIPVKIIAYKMCLNETFYICLHAYKKKTYISVIYDPKKEIFGDAFVFIEDIIEFNSDDISFICGATKYITDKFAEKFNNRFYDLVFIIKKKKKKVTLTIKRKLDKDNFIEVKLNIYNKKYEIKSSK